MPTKNQLLEHLDTLRALIASEESDADAQFWYREVFWRNGPDENGLEHRLGRVESLLRELLSSRRTSCQFTGEISDGVARLIVGSGPEARGGAHKYLSDKIAGARELSICDPYVLLPYKGASPSDYVNSLVDLLPKSLRILELFVKPRVRNREVAERLTSICKDRAIHVQCIRTEMLHDRVWIADHERAFTVGTSFNGLGSRCAFILELPSEDRRAFIRELASIRANVTKSKGA